MSDIIINQQTKMITVIMSTFARNKPDVRNTCTSQLRRALDSVLAQTFINFDFVVIDDGSSDGTSDILEQYQQKDVRIKVIRYDTSCKGFTAMRYNSAIQLAQTNFIAYMFDDDCWRPTMLQTLFQEFICNPSLDLTYGQALVINTLTGMQWVHGYEWDRTKLLLGTNCVPNPCVLIRRTVFDKFGYLDETEQFCRNNDWEYWCRLSKGLANIKFVKQIVADVYINNDSITTTRALDVQAVIALVKARYG